SRRVVRKRERLIVEHRAASANFAETAAFLDDAKRILIFSDAGGTGRSYHAELSARNRRLRVHYLLEPGWKADAAIQGLGRTNR
ncbi:strawberry notch C-terminal domain-containing protein, partial [Acinetobacter baumannii]